MLKIKDNVDLKELEKFKFEKYAFGYHKMILDRDFLIEIDIRKTSRNIRLIAFIENTTIAFKNELDYLFDLIQAGLVEKVEDKWNIVLY